MTPDHSLGSGERDFTIQGFDIAYQDSSGDGNRNPLYKNNGKSFEMVYAYIENGHATHMSGIMHYKEKNLFPYKDGREARYIIIDKWREYKKNKQSEYSKRCNNNIFYDVPYIR